MADAPHVPTLTDVALLPRWAKVLFLSRCAARVIPLIRNQWPALSANDLITIGLVGGNADASARLGREVHIGSDPLPRLTELIQAAEQERRLAGYGLAVCATAAGLLQVESAETATSLVASALEQMIQAYAASGLNEGAVVGSVWFDYTALRDAATAGGWDDQTRMTDGILGELWPYGTPPGWPAE
jgi:hypothetical protein